jgi:hypothetical protein
VSAQSDQDDLTAERTRLIAILRLIDATQPQDSDGPFRIDFNDGVRSYQWNGTRTALIANIKELGPLIQVVGGPFEIVSVGRG